jgi:two-component system, chemotaxis family, chemotaxis protein CheY
VRALIVDDSAMMRKVVERALRQAGLNLTEVIQANNGAEALTFLREAAGSNAAFDLIFSDINMPIMDGLEFIEQRKQEGLAPGVPVVMITTEGSTPMVMRALAAGARGYICKPFTTDQVKACVMPLLGAA